MVTTNSFDHLGLDDLKKVASSLTQELEKITNERNQLRGVLQRAVGRMKAKCGNTQLDEDKAVDSLIEDVNNLVTWSTDSELTAHKFDMQLILDGFKDQVAARKVVEIKLEDWLIKILIRGCYQENRSGTIWYKVFSNSQEYYAGQDLVDLGGWEEFTTPDEPGRVWFKKKKKEVLEDGV